MGLFNVSPALIVNTLSGSVFRVCFTETLSKRRPLLVQPGIAL